MPSTFNAVLVIVIFLMPGFIARKVMSSIFAGAEPTEVRTILDSVTLSSLIYATLSWLLVWAWMSKWYENVFALAILAVLVLFVSPIVVALSLTKLMETTLARRIRETFGILHPVQRAWDYFFRRGLSCWVVATLKDGRVLGGWYGPSSFASSDPTSQDLYLEKICKLSPDGKIESMADLTLGGIIDRENIELIEFFEHL